MPDTVELLERLIGFDTTSRNSNLDLLAWVEGLLEQHGVASRRIPNEDGSKANLVARIGPDVAGGVVLCGHTDTVPVDGQPWDTDPHTLIEKDGRLYGRGTADMKGFIACALAAVPTLVAAELRRPITLAFTYDEEVGCVGAPSLAADLVDNEPRPAVVITGEPTSMRVVRAHKGIRVSRTTVTGLDGHSSQGQPTASAIIGAGRIIAHIGDLADELRESGVRAEGFHPPHTTANVGTVEGGQAVNIVPRHCAFTWEFRPVPGEDADAIADAVRTYARDEILPRLRASAPGADVTFEVIADVPALDAAGNAEAAALVAGLAGADEGP
ncbi:MAG TPA: acetylornithine deacetylase, partial [Nitriliruptorales bacterium]